MPNKKGYKWYNNGLIEKCFDKCPDGWVSGRLPMVEEKKLHYKNNGTHNITKEKRQEINKKISLTKQNKTKEEKEIYSKHVSDSRKEKGLGKTPWNKGKSGLQVAWNKGLKLGASWNKGLKMSDDFCFNVSQALKGRVPWNKGKHTGEWSEEQKKVILEKQYITKSNNNSFNISNVEEQYYLYLIDKYGVDNVLRQYKDDRYPFLCDFYIKSEDLFIELNLHWTHGGHLFTNSDVDKVQLNTWKERALKSDFYKNAIETWTIRDVLKYNTAKENKLNYLVFYFEDDLYE